MICQDAMLHAYRVLLVLWDKGELETAALITHVTNVHVRDVGQININWVTKISVKSAKRCQRNHKMKCTDVALDKNWKTVVAVNRDPVQIVKKESTKQRQDIDRLIVYNALQKNVTAFLTPYLLNADLVQRENVYVNLDTTKNSEFAFNVRMALSRIHLATKHALHAAEISRVQ
jgi:hypothetical protein